VVITGVGLRTAFGDAAETWQALGEGRSALVEYRLPGAAGFPALVGAPVKPFGLAAELPDRKLHKYMNLATELTVSAAGSALADAGLAMDPAARAGLALFCTTSWIAFDLAEVTRTMGDAVLARRLDYGYMGEHGLKSCNPLMPFKMLLNMPLGLTSIVHGLQGENFILYPDSSQGGACLEVALRGIRAGRLRRVLLASGAQSLSFMPLATLLRLGRLAVNAGAAASFAPGHAGWAPADLGAALLLESYDAARERGATVRAEVLAAGQHRIPSPDPADRHRSRETLWRRLLPGGPPGLVLSTGNLDQSDDQAELQSVHACWPGVQAPLESPDGRLG
jgi:3-oxoacyl-[acyl-carrier-protein] synthase II